MTARPLVHDAIRRHARRAPSSPALRWRGTTLSYAELDAWSDAFAGVIAESGAGQGSLVGVLASRRPETVACFLGILKAGATYVPIYTEYPEERIAFILSDLGDDLACTFFDAEARSGRPGKPSIAMADVPRTAGKAPSTDVDPESLAYIVYTSGSTGTPKGVMIKHRSLAAVVPELIREYAIRPVDRVLHCAPLGFDTSISEILRGLCAGACLCIAPADVTAKPDFFYRLRFLAEERVTRAVLPAALLRSARPSSRLPDLNVLATTGEASTEELVDKWAPGRTLLNAWGSTEGTFATTIMRLVPGRGERQPVGRPIRGTEVWVVGDDGERVPDGEVGQIFIGGIGVSAGYYKRPSLTAERFVPNVWGSLSPTAFATGDLGSMLAGGYLDCLGRIDNQVKVSGFRVDISEVETALRACSVPVSDAAVVAVATRFGDTALVANVVLGRSADAGSLAEREQDVSAAIADDLKRLLPAYALPRAVRLWDALPLNAHGKVDRRRLAAEGQKR